MYTAFKSYLETLNLSATTRKLYLADIRHFLAYLAEEPTLDLVSSKLIYAKYLSHLSSQSLDISLIKRTLASLRQFGTFLHHTYNITSPTAKLSISGTSTSQTERPEVIQKYIKLFIKYLNSQQLSLSTIKSYKSDITRYLDWGTQSIPSTQIEEVLSHKNIKKYLKYLDESATTQLSTIERKQKSLAKFATWMELYRSRITSPDNMNIQPQDIKLSNLPKTSHLNPDGFTQINQTNSSSDDLSEETANRVKKSNYRNVTFPLWSPNLRNFLSLAVLLLFTITLSIFAYRQFSTDTRLTAAYPSTPVSPNRQLSFQGRLENPSGTPITTATNFVFKLFDASTVGTELYSTGTCSITPDSDGVFNTQIGNTCGAGIPSSVFSENSDVWLEVTVGAEVLDPRQQLATVAYALNSETIQGFPISSTVSAIRNTVVPMNQWGEIIVGEQSPKLTGVAGTFQISAPSLSLTTTTGSSGNITIAPDGTGQVNLLGNTTSTNFFNVSNAQLTTGSLITGTVGNDNTGFNLFDLLSGSSPTSKFSVDATGNVTFAGAIMPGGSAGTSGYLLTSAGSGASPTWTDPSTLGGGGGSSGVWSDLLAPTANLTLSHSTYTTVFDWATGTGTDNLFSLTTANSSNGTGSLLNLQTGTSSTVSPLRVRSGATEALFVGNNGRVGLGTTSPNQQLEITENFRLPTSTYNSGNTYGVLYKAGDRFMHDFNYGNNGTVTTDGRNTFLGINSGNFTMGSTATTVSQSSYNTAVGYSSLSANTTGQYNSAFGESALLLNTTGSSNTAVGRTALRGATTGGSNTAVGRAALYSNNTGYENNALGRSALENNTSGYRNLAIGMNSLFGITTGHNNIALGYNAGRYITDGSTANQTSNTSLYLGSDTKSLASGNTNEIVLGHNTTGFGSNTVAYGNSSMTKHIFQAGSVGIGLSDPLAPLDVVGDIYLSSGLSTFRTAVSDGTIEATRFCTGDGETNCVTDFSSIISPWTDAGTYLYPTAAETLGNSAIGGANKIAGLYLADSSPLAFGTDNDITFSFTGSTLGSVLTPGSMIGINTATALATLDVRSSLGTIPVASISGNTSMATLIVDQSGSGDIFTASSSGQTRFVVKNNGNVGIDVADPTNKLEIGGSTSTISNDAGDITLNSASGNISFAGGSLINILNLYAAGELGLGLSDAVAKLDVHGAVVGKALVMFNEIGDQDIFTASASGTTRFRLRNDGSLTLDGEYLNFGLTEGTSGYGIRDNAGVMEFKTLSGAWTPMGAGGASWWDQVSGTIQPYNTTVDLLLGGVATASARIGLININSGTPTATLSAGTSGGLYLNASGTIATTAKQTLSLGDATTTGNIILQGGNVGIGVASPTEKLEVNGYVVAQRFVDTASSTFYLDPASTGTSLMVAGNMISNGAFSLTSNGTNGNITINAGTGTVLIGATGAGKLDAGTIDPPYTINGEKFATYMAGMTGVKEETTGTVMATEHIPGAGYRATLDFANSLTGSDLWIFAKTSNLKESLDKMVVLLSASSNGRTWYEIDPHAGKLHLYSSIPSMISYRLTAPRFDADAWSNIRDANSPSVGHIINDEGGWSVSDSIANLITQSQSQLNTLFGNIETNLISPLSAEVPISIVAPVVITENQTSDSPELVVEGEIQSKTISARVAQLQEIYAENIIAKNIIADTIEANQIIGLDAKIASFSSNLNESEISSITERIKARLQALSGDSPSAEDIPTPDVPEPEPISQDLATDIASSSALMASLEADFAVINDYLAVIGQATITSLDVTGNFYTNSVQSKDLELAIQPLGGRINLASNTLIVDSTGQVAINGDLTVSGRILADSASLNSLEIGTPQDASSSALGNLLAIYNEAGQAVATIDASGSANLASLTTSMITIASSGTATDSSALSSLIGTAESNSTAGVSTLVSPGTEIMINSPHITENSLIYLTPTGNTDNKVLFVKSKESCTTPAINCKPNFIVAIDKPALNDISFNWWIIELAQPKVAATTDQQI